MSKNDSKLDIKQSEQEIFSNDLKKIIKDINEVIDDDIIQSNLEEKNVLNVDIINKSSVKDIVEKYNIYISSDNIISNNKKILKPIYNILMQVPKISKLLIDLSIKGYNPCLSSRKIKGKSLFSKHDEVYVITLK